ncbi:MAG: EamA family transporter [Methyloligellaceae bacterium]
MRPRHIALALLTAVIWGLAFVATELGLRSFSAPQLTALRFLVACLPVLLLPRPRIAWSWLILIGLTLFTGQFLLLFFAFTKGMPAGVASVTQQIQAFFTVVLAALFLRDVPTLRQSAGMGIALAGLLLISLTVGGDLTWLGLGLALAAALSWAVGNVLVKRIGAVPMVPLMAWLSLVPPLPALAVSGLLDANPSLVDAIAGASWVSIAAALYLGLVSTSLAYAIWGHLLTRYPAAMVTPFALVAPCAGMAASALILGETFGPLRLAGMGLILAGLAVVLLPVDWAAPARRKGK